MQKIMKKSLLLMATAILLTVGCKESVSPLTPGDGLHAYTFTAANPVVRSVISGTDTVLTVKWSGKDKVGIYGKGAVDANNYSYDVIPDEEEAAKCVLSPSEKGYVFPYSSQAQSFYAYHPFSAEESSGPDKAPVNVPAVQTQKKAGDMSHIPDLLFFRSDPVNLNGEETVNFQFHGILSIVQLKLRMEPGAPDVAIKNIRLKSTEDNLSLKGQVDLTSGSDEITAVAGSGEILLEFGESVTLSSSAFRSLYLVVAPGHHAAGQLSVEVKASDNSVNTISLPAVTFQPGANYIQEVTVDLEGFVLPEKLSVTADKTVLAAGDSVSFTLAGFADKVVFWSGEENHNYTFYKEGHTVLTDVKMAFKTYLQAGGQNKPLKVKVSTDFSGASTEAAIQAATWTDITSRFTFAEDCSATSMPGNKDNFVSSGTVDITDAFGENQDGYVCFFYHIDAFVSALNNGRTQAYVADIVVDDEHESDTSNLFTQDEDSGNMTLIAGDSYDSDGTKPTKTASVGVRFNSTFKPTTDRDAYAFTSAISRRKINIGNDTGELLKDIGDASLPGVWSYTFNTPGQYKVVFEVLYKTLSGDKEETVEFDITVQ